MTLVTDYVISLTNLYGLVHRDKVLEIYNMQNDAEVDMPGLTIDVSDNMKEIKKNFVETYGDYFVHESIMEFEEFDLELAKRRGKPFYIPKQKELLKYKDELYFERTREYEALLKYIKKNFFKNNRYYAEMLCEDVHDECQLGSSVGGLLDPFNRRGIEFEDESQVKEVMDLVMNLSNNVRLWENNGFTPNELHHKVERPRMNPLPDQDYEVTAPSSVSETFEKVGRNSPCPCGSGKKYKKCCLNKV